MVELRSSPEMMKSLRPFTGATIPAGPVNLFDLK
jgi:hypothetical protein